MKEPDGKQHDIPPRKARKHLTGDLNSRKLDNYSKTIFVVLIKVRDNKEPRMKLIIRPKKLSWVTNL